MNIKDGIFMETIINNINVVIKALNNIEVKGYQNMSNLLGSINSLSEIVNTIHGVEEQSGDQG